MVLHGEIGKLGKKRSRTKINVMLKEGTCNRQENKKERKKEVISGKKIICYCERCMVSRDIYTPLDGTQHKIHGRSEFFFY